MRKFKQYVEKKRRLKKIKPLNFMYDRYEQKNDETYLINWLKNVGIEATDISKYNKYASVLVLNVKGNGSTYNMYCINISLYRGATITEEHIMGVYKEAYNYGAIPVIVVIDDVGNNLGLLAKMLGVQFIIASQLEGLNTLLINGKIPEVSISNAMFISKIAYYARMKLA